MEEDVIRLRLQREEYEKEREELANLKRDFSDIDDRIRSVDWELEVLGQKYRKVLDERNALRQTFTQSRYQIDQQTSFSSFLLAKKLSAMQKMRERKEAEMAEVLVRANLEPSVYAQLSNRVGNIMEEKNEMIHDLHGEMDRVVSLRSSLNRHVENLLTLYGVKRSDLGMNII